MTRLSRKLRSSRGASMLLGLLFLLVCLTVGAVVLTAASATAGRTERNRQEQQDYLAVASAVELVKEDLANAKFTGSYFKEVKAWSEDVDTGKEDADGKPITETKHFSETRYGKNGTVLTDSSILAEISADISALYYDHTGLFGNTAPVEMSYPISFAPDPEHEFPAVIGTLTLSPALFDDETRPQYPLVVTLQTTGGTSTTTLYFPAKVSSGESTSATGDNPKYTTTTYTTTVTWSDPTIKKGAGR